jgi:hypothetical protein
MPEFMYEFVFNILLEKDKDISKSIFLGVLCKYMNEKIELLYPYFRSEIDEGGGTYRNHYYLED